VMHEGRVLAYGPPREVFARYDDLLRAQIMPPQITQLGRRLAAVGLPDDALSVAEFSAAYQRLRGGGP
jgi:hypothetical protein